MLEADENFEQHLSIIKEHYGHKESYETKKNKKKQLSEVVQKKEKSMPSILSIEQLDK